MSLFSVFYMVLPESGLTCYSLPDVWKESGCKVFQRRTDSPRAKVQFEVIPLRFGRWICIWNGVFGVWVSLLLCGS